MLFFKHHQSKKPTPPEPLPVWVNMPVRIQLKLHIPLSSVKMTIRLPLMLEELQVLKTHAVRNHILLEDAYVEYLKTAIYEHENMKAMVKDIQEKYQTDRQVELDIHSLGKVTLDLFEFSAG